MGVDAVRAAVSDAGITWSDVDYAVGGSNVSGKPDSMVAQLGLTGVPFATVKNGCATGGVALTTAANSLLAHSANVAAGGGVGKQPQGGVGGGGARGGTGGRGPRPRG